MYLRKSGRLVLPELTCEIILVCYTAKTNHEFVLA